MTKEVVLQMIWDRHFDLVMEKDLDDICEEQLPRHHSNGRCF